ACRVAGGVGLAIAHESGFRRGGAGDDDLIVCMQFDAGVGPRLGGVDAEGVIVRCRGRGRGWSGGLRCKSEPEHERTNSRKKCARLENHCSKPRFILPAFTGAVARTVRGVTVARLRQSAIRPHAGLRIHAPEQAVVRPLHGWIVLRGDELPFPAQAGAEVGMAGIEAIGFGNHAAPPAAFNIARLTAICASRILWLLFLSAFAPSTDFWAATDAVSSFTSLPARKAAASAGIHGVGATAPITMRALFTVPPSMSRATAATARGQSKAFFWRTS